MSPQLCVIKDNSYAVTYEGVTFPNNDGEDYSTNDEINIPLKSKARLNFAWWKADEQHNVSMDSLDEFKWSDPESQGEHIEPNINGGVDCGRYYHTYCTRELSEISLIMVMFKLTRNNRWEFGLFNPETMKYVRVHKDDGGDITCRINNDLIHTISSDDVLENTDIMWSIRKEKNRIVFVNTSVTGNEYDMGVIDDLSGYYFYFRQWEQDAHFVLKGLSYIDMGKYPIAYGGNVGAVNIVDEESNVITGASVMSAPRPFIVDLLENSKHNYKLQLKITDKDGVVEKEFPLNIVLRELEMTAPDMTHYVSREGYFEVTLTDHITSNPVPSKNVIFTINDELLGESITDNEGIATLEYTRDTLGIEQVTISTEEDETYNAKNIQIGLTTLPRTNTLLQPITPTTSYYKIPQQYTITLLNQEDNTPLKNEKITILNPDNNEEITTKNTDNNGQIKFTQTYNTLGPHKIKAKTEVSNPYYDTEKTYTITTEKDTPILTINEMNDNFTFTDGFQFAELIIQLTNSIGTPLQDKTLNMKEYINNTTILNEYTTEPTSNNGLTFPIIEPYAGIRKIQTTFTEYGYNTTTENTIINYDITLQKTIKDIIDGKGILNVNKNELPPGVYSAYMKYHQSKTFGESENTQQIHKKEPTYFNIIYQEDTPILDDAIIIVRLCDTSGTPLANREIISTINNTETQTLKTDATGCVYRKYSNDTVGEDTLKFTFHAEQKYAGDTITILQNWTKITPILEVDDVESYTAENTQLKATAKYTVTKKELQGIVDGEAVINTTVTTTDVTDGTIQWNGLGSDVLATANTNNDGIATATYHRTTTGTVTCRAYLIETEKYNQTVAQYTISTLANRTTKITMDKTTYNGYYGTVTTMGGTLTYQDPNTNEWKPLAGKEIRFKQGKTFLIILETDEQGKFKIEYEPESYFKTLQNWSGIIKFMIIFHATDGYAYCDTTCGLALTNK